MKFSIDDLFRHAFVMVKDDAEYSQFCERMQAQGFDKMPAVFHGNFPMGLIGDKKDRTNSVLCTLAHCFLVKMAKAMDFPYVTIFESDCYPMNNCRDVLASFLDDGGVPDDADEVVLGNLNFVRKHEKFLKDADGRFGRIIKNVWGAHAAVIFKKGYDSWINGMLGCDWEIHADYFNILVPNCYVATRNFFIQWRGKLEYPELMVDKENLSDFPVNV